MTFCRAPGLSARIRGWLAEALTGPIQPPERAFAALCRQPELAASAKLVLAAEGHPALMAEIPWDGNIELALQRAHEALDAALSWIKSSPEPCPEQASPEDTVRTIEATLDGDARWRWQKAGTQSFQATLASLAGTRVTVAALHSGCVRVALPDLPLRTAGQLTRLALEVFAMESAGRLRLVRVSVSPGPAGRTHAVREVLLADGIQLDRWLPAAVEALAVADNETRRALRALTDSRVAQAYLATRATPAATQRDHGWVMQEAANAPVTISRPRDGG